VSPDELVGAVYLPGRKGSFQVELLAATRARGRIAYVLDQSIAAVVGELQAGRPVLVMQNLGVKAIPVWHYAVVVGFDPSRDELILRSGTDARRRTAITRFDRTWERSKRWAFVVLKPGQLPIDADPARYFASVAALEATGQLAAAEAGYLAMAGRWPLDPDAQLGLGNVYFAQDRLIDAENAYRRALELSGGTLVVAGNNLAMALLTRGCATAALAEAERVLAPLDEQHALYGAVAETHAEAKQAVTSGVGCPGSLDLLEDVGDAKQVQNDDHDKYDADDR
jgi:tetratricopeptide (TPR) repeat protein